jgi:hypothetical protein
MVTTTAQLKILPTFSNDQDNESVIHHVSRCAEILLKIKTKTDVLEVAKVSECGSEKILFNTLGFSCRTILAELSFDGCTD